MGVDGWQGKAAEARKAALTPEQLRSRFNVISDEARSKFPKSSRGAGLFSETANIAHVRERDRNTFVAGEPVHKEYYLPEYPNFGLSKQEYEKHLRIRAEREQATERRKEQAVIDEQKRHDDAIKSKRDAWYAEQEKLERSQEVERGLVKSQISSILESENCTLAEAEATRAKIIAECGEAGLKLASLWEHFLKAGRQK